MALTNPLTKPRRCRGCGTPLRQPQSGRPRTYCRASCRQKAYLARKLRRPAVWHSRASDEWATPGDRFKEWDQEFGPFTLDAAATADNALCPRFFTMVEDGLVQPWEPRTWVNSPYSSVANSVQKGTRSPRQGPPWSCSFPFGPIQPGGTTTPCERPRSDTSEDVSSLVMPDRRHRSPRPYSYSGDPPDLSPVKDRRNRSRTVPLPDVVLTALVEHVRLYGTGPEGLLFTTPSKEPMRQTTFSDLWRRAAGPLGIPTGEGYHLLRHYYASVLIDGGESVTVVRDRLGHTSAQMTLDIYGHLWPENDDKTAADRAFGLRVPPVSHEEASGQ